MSEGTTEVVEQEKEEAAATKRKTLSLGERIKVVDYLRSLVEPIVADSNAAIATLVSAGSGVEINWQQLKYMIDDLAEMNLGAKVHVKSLLSGDDERMAALDAKLEMLSTIVSNLNARIEALEDKPA